MLTRTFLHLPGVGACRERAMWDAGTLSWDDALNRRDLFDQGPPPALEEGLALSRQKLAEQDARWFASRLGPHAWRLAADFDDGRIAYLDIETDGSPADCDSPDGHGPGGLTVASVWDGLDARVFVRGRNLDQLPACLARYPALCTFNGKIFDLPYLEHRFGRGFYRGAHLDLRPITRAVGLRGGLKKIEQQLCIGRPREIRHYSGWDAVKLWSCYKRGRRDALGPLARYNLADAVNLQTVLRAAYNRAVSAQDLPFRRFEQLAEEGVNQAVESAVREAMG